MSPPTPTLTRLFRARESPKEPRASGAKVASQFIWAPESLYLAGRRRCPTKRRAANSLCATTTTGCPARANPESTAASGLTGNGRRNCRNAAAAADYKGGNLCKFLAEIRPISSSNFKFQIPHTHDEPSPAQPQTTPQAYSVFASLRFFLASFSFFFSFFLFLFLFLSLFREDFTFAR